MARVSGRGQLQPQVWAANFGSGRRGAGRSYEAFIPDPVAELDPVFTGATATLVERAARAVRELNDSGAALLSLEGMARQLLRSEALASSRIEGLNLSHRKLALAQLDAGQYATYKATEVLANMQAMEEAVRIGSSPEPLTTADVCDIHRALAIVPPLDRIAGKLRHEPGWIGGATPADAEFVPPPFTEVERLVNDLCVFMNRDDIPAVAQAAIAHAQFETIHPFGDGNGRVGRCLIHVLLRRRGVADHYVPPVSLVLGANKDRYIAGLTDFQRDRIDAWTAQFAASVEAAAQYARGFSSDVAELQQDWLRRAGRLRSDAAARTVIANLPSFPFITSAVVQKLTGKSDVTALNALDLLAQKGILTRHHNRRRGDSWEAKELFILLEAFEHAVRMP